MKTFQDLIGECRNTMLGTNIIPAHNHIVQDLPNLTKKQLKKVIVNYSGFSNISIHCLLDSAVRLHEWKYMQKAAMDNIAEEMGSQTDNVPHLEIMRYGYRNELGIETDNVEYTSSTEYFFKELKRLLNNRNKAILTGALVAFEGIAIPEFHIVDPIVDAYLAHDNKIQDPEWETSRYIEGHKVFEIGHEQELINAAALYILTSEQQDDFSKGYKAMVKAFDEWWGHLYYEIT